MLDSPCHLCAVPIAHQHLPRSGDGTINLQELIRRLAEDVVNEAMCAEADRMCALRGTSGNGCRVRKLITCVGEPALRVPKLRGGSFFPEDLLERYGRADRAVVAAVPETCATGTSTRKVGRIMSKMGVEHLPKDQVSSMSRTIDAEVGELMRRPVDGLRTPYVWLGATHAKCRRGGRVASTAAVTAIGLDEDGHRVVLGKGVADTESYGSWLGFLREVRSRGVRGAQLVISDAHQGLRRTIPEAFQGAAWQRCAVHLMRDCAREARNRRERARVARIVSTVFDASDPTMVGAMYHEACGMLEEECSRDAATLEDAEPDALAYLDFPVSHWGKLRTNNCSERTNREIKRRTSVMQAFPSESSLERLVGAVLLERAREWDQRRYISGDRMGDLYDRPIPRPVPDGSTKKRARRALEASLELAEGLRAA